MCVNDVNFITGGEGYVIPGVSYWTKADGELLKHKLEQVLKSSDWKNVYWDNIAKDNLKNMDVHIKKISSSDWFEIDCLEGLKTLKAKIEE